jgi:hypothetical protein
VYMGDSAAAGSNAFKAVFEDPQDLDGTSIRVNMCFVHVQTIWCNHNRGKLQDAANHEKVKSDLTKLNNSMWIPEMVPIAQQMMYQKWREVYKEPAYCSAFVAAWDGHLYTRAESNAGGVGGLPSCNNMLEAKNNTIKKELMRERPSVTTLVSRAADWLQLNAVNEGSFGREHNLAVWGAHRQ